VGARITTPSATEFPATADIVIVGGGIVGTATAFFASRAGLRVIVLERRAALATLTTTRSLEAFRAQFEDPADVAMMRESIGVFESFPEVVGIPGHAISLHQQGYLFVSRGAQGPARVAARVAGQRAAGLEDVECLTGEEARRRFPYLAPDVTAAAFRARDGWLASHEVTYGFARGSGARFFVETELTGFEIRSGRLAGVRTNRGRVEAPACVIAAGPYSAQVAAGAGVDLPLTAVRRQRAGIKAHALIPRFAPMTVDLESGAHWRPEGPGAYLGWSAAFPEEPREPRDDVPADWRFPAMVLAEVARVAPFWEEVVASLSRGNVTLEAGLYELTPDAKPIIGAGDTVEGLYFNTGYSGHGVMGSPAGGRLLVDLLLGRKKEEENPYRLARFQGGSSVTPSAKTPL
jgi:sarcosine oxidase subunit beta